MKLYTLCYLIKDEDFLMLYRNKKKNDINEGKWVGVGGHIEEGETPLESIKREIKEETGYDAIKVKFRGMISFVYNNEMDYIYVFTCDSFKGDIINCNEGDLKYINKNKVMDLNLWEGDKYFLKELIENNEKIWSYKMEYENDRLIKVEKEF